MAKVVALSNLPEVKILEDITRETAERVIQELSYFKGQPVALSIFSNGGDVHASQAIAGYITNPANQMQVEVRVYGNAASGAMIISAAAQKAYIDAGAFALVHKARAVDRETGKVVSEEDLSKEERDVLSAMNDSQVELFKKRTGMQAGTIEKLMDQDRDMSAEEAVEKGFFDGIIPQAVRLAAFKTMNSTPMAEDKKTVTFKVSAADALKAIASGEIHVSADQVQTADAETVAALEKEKTDLQAKLTEVEAKLKLAEDGKIEAEASKDVEAKAKTEMENELKAAKEAVGKYQAAIEDLKKNPLKAQTLPDGTQVVIPGGEKEESAYKATPDEQRSSAAMAAYKAAIKNIQPANNA